MKKLAIALVFVSLVFAFGEKPRVEVKDFQALQARVELQESQIRKQNDTIASLKVENRKLSSEMREEIDYLTMDAMDALEASDANTKVIDKLKWALK